jgi:hypothetical protein
MLFSQKHGYKPVKNVIQLESIDTELRNGLWNALDIFYWSEGQLHEHLSSPHNSKLKGLFHVLWLDYFKKPIDTIRGYPYLVEKEIRDYFFSCNWFEVYDLVEFIANNYAISSTNEQFMRYSNSILEREVSGWRFIGGEIAPITSEEEIAEIEKALESTISLKPVTTHLKTALNFLSDKQTPDYRNSIKESISAVEAICRLITGSSQATLGQALKVIKDKIPLHPALEQAFSKLYGYTSDADGIRHSLLDESKLDFEDAKFILVSCSAFINYLKLKASKAGIKL